MEYFELWTWEKDQKEPTKTQFQTARLAFAEGRRQLFPEDSKVVEYQVMQFTRKCLGGEQDERFGATDG